MKNRRYSNINTIIIMPETLKSLAVRKGLYEAELILTTKAGINPDWNDLEKNIVSLAKKNYDNNLKPGRNGELGHIVDVYTVDIENGPAWTKKLDYANEKNKDDPSIEKFYYLADSNIKNYLLEGKEKAIENYIKNSKITKNLKKILKISLLMSGILILALKNVL